ncbi:MAG: AI-2E family transporter [Acidobacteriota bacterium]|nr:AI-2E family transporter [Blastocatellia bacterium]MDW8240656.1 AI-2E family transporter [Acidobacteriota bacterium]
MPVWLIGVPLSLGTLTGFGYLISYVGAFVSVVLTLLLVLLTTEGWWPLLGVIVVYVGVHALEGFYLTPRILGDRLELHPMVVIIGLILAGSAFGILGIVLALPVLAVLKVWLEVLLEPYLQSLAAQQPITATDARDLASLPDG